MEFKVENGDGIDSWKEVTLVYSAALRQMETKMQILNDEFQHVHQYNPIEYIKRRIKTPERIVKAGPDLEAAATRLTMGRVSSVK